MFNSATVYYLFPFPKLSTVTGIVRNELNILWIKEAGDKRWIIIPCV